MGFQKVVNLQPAPAVAGDFASSNPRASVLAGEGSLVAGPGGVTVGKFAWVGEDGRTVTSFNSTGNAPDGFVHREQQALITVYLGEESMVIPEGMPVVLHDEGDFWAKLTGATASTNGAQVYANNETGDAQLGATAGATGTGSIGATFTATGAETALTVSAVTGFISVGDTVAGAGIPADTTIIEQVSGTTGGAGVYTTSANTTIAAATATAFGDVLNITAATGVFHEGDIVSGTGIPAGSAIVAQLTGPAGGVGQYQIDTPATAYAAATALTVAVAIATNFVARSLNAIGELFKISTWGKV